MRVLVQGVDLPLAPRGSCTACHARLVWGQHLDGTLVPSCPDCLALWRISEAAVDEIIEKTRFGTRLTKGFDTLKGLANAHV